MLGAGERRVVLRVNDTERHSLYHHLRLTNSDGVTAEGSVFLGYKYEAPTGITTLQPSGRRIGLPERPASGHQFIHAAVAFLPPSE